MESDRNTEIGQLALQDLFAGLQEAWHSLGPYLIMPPCCRSCPDHSCRAEGLVHLNPRPGGCRVGPPLILDALHNILDGLNEAWRPLCPAWLFFHVVGHVRAVPNTPEDLVLLFLNNPRCCAASTGLANGVVASDHKFVVLWTTKIVISDKNWVRGHTSVTFSFPPRSKSIGARFLVKIWNILNNLRNNRCIQIDRYQGKNYDFYRPCAFLFGIYLVCPWYAGVSLDQLELLLNFMIPKLKKVILILSQHMKRFLRH